MVLAVHSVAPRVPIAVINNSLECCRAHTQSEGAHEVLPNLRCQQGHEGGGHRRVLAGRQAAVEGPLAQKVIDAQPQRRIRNWTAAALSQTGLNWRLTAAQHKSELRTQLTSTPFDYWAILTITMAKQVTLSFFFFFLSASPQTEGTIQQTCSLHFTWSWYLWVHC